MDRSAHVEKLKTRTDYGTGTIGEDKTFKLEKKQPQKEKKHITPTGEETPTEKFTGFIATHELVAKEGEPKEISELYFTFRETGSHHALYKLIEIKIKSLQALAGDRAALTDEELKPILDLIEWCPGGKELSKEQLTGEVRRAAESIYQRELSGKGEKGLGEAGDFWDMLRMKTLIDNKIKTVPAKGREALEKQIDEQLNKREDLADVAELYYFLTGHGVDPQTLRLSDVLRDHLINNKHEDWYKKLVRDEDSRDVGANLAKRTAVDSEYLAINPREYWRGKLLVAIEDRLKAMRSSVAAYLEKTGDQQKMEIGRPKQDKSGRGLETALAYQSVTGESLLGQFLDSMNRGGYWRGKAYLDVLYWSLYRGQLVGNVEAMSDKTEPDINAARKEVNNTLRQYSGEVALSNMEKDSRFIDALNVLYFLNQGETYEKKLQILGEKYGLWDEKKKEFIGELPDFITDAVMFEKVFVLDALNMARGDLRIVAYHPAQIFDRELVTDTQGQVYELLGKNMRLTESPMMKMGWWDASNARFNYEAIVPDTREYNPKENADQLDKIWQHCFMYLLELNDRRHDLTRKFEDKNEKIAILPELTLDILTKASAEGKGVEEILLMMAKPMTATQGQTGEFLGYQNGRLKIKKDENNGVYDHRQTVFDRIRTQFEEDTRLLRERGFGKAGWDEPLRRKVNRVINFLQRDFSGANRLIIDNKVIEKNAGEIFYNDDLADLLDDFKDKPNNPAYADHTNELSEFLNMREVLRDSRSWGFVFDLYDPEVHKRLNKNMDLTFVENYDIAANESAKMIREMSNGKAFEDVYTIQVTPAKVLEAVEHMGHRRNGLQNYWPVFRLLEFVEMAMMKRLSEMEIASAQDLQKMVDSMGDVQLGAKEKVKELLGITDDLWEARKTIVGKIESIGYMEEMTLSRLELQKRGLLGNWEEAIRAHAKRELAAEAFNWGLTRTLPLEQQAGIDDELAAGWKFFGRRTFDNVREDTKYMYPIESWQVPDVVINEDGEVVIEPLAVQGVNRVQMEQYFRKLEIEEAGYVFGGAREAKIALKPGGYFSAKPKDDKSKGDRAGFMPNGEERVLITQEYEDKADGKKWFKVGLRKGEEVNEVGWIHQDMLEIKGYFGQSLNEPIRYGEVRYDGGRFIWHKFKKDERKGLAEGWHWTWIEGKWLEDPVRQRLSFYTNDRIEEINKNNKKEEKIPLGFERRLELGTKESVEILEADVEGHRNGRLPELLFDPKTLGSLQEKDPETGMFKEANYPFLIFKGAKEREEFYFGRGRMLFSLRMGTPVGTTKSGGFQAGAALPGWMYRAKVGALNEVTRFGDEVLKMMRLQIRAAIYRGGLATELERHFGKVYLQDEILAKLKKTYEKAMTGEQWGEDVDIMHNLMAETPFWDLLFNREFIGKTKNRFLVDVSNGLLKFGAGILKWRLPIEALPLNVPIALLTTAIFGGYSWISSVGIARSAALILGVGYPVSFLVGMVGVFASRFIKPDLSRAVPYKLPGIKNFHAYVPVE